MTEQSATGQQEVYQMKRATVPEAEIDVSHRTSDSLPEDEREAS